MELNPFDKYMQDEIVQIFSELLAFPTPSGMESNLADHIYKKCIEWGYNPKRDYAGNVYVQITGQKVSEETCCLAAHMDEIGLMVTKINSDGTLNVERVGGTLTWKFGERPVEIYGDHRLIQGVTAMGPGHAASNTQTRLEWKDVKIITGLTPEELRTCGIKAGTFIALLQSDRGPIIFGDKDNPMIAAWTFDDKMGIVTLLRILKSLKEKGLVPLINLIIAFTTSEEIGCFGAKHLAQSLNPTYFIAVDGCPFASESLMVLDDRPGIRIRDRTFFYSQNLIKALSQSAKRAGTDLQQLVYVITGSDAGAVGNIGVSPQAACIGHIRKNSHGFEVAYLSVFENLYKTLWEFVTSWKGSKIDY